MITGIPGLIIQPGLGSEYRRISRHRVRITVIQIIVGLVGGRKHPAVAAGGWKMKVIIAWLHRGKLVET